LEYSVDSSNDGDSPNELAIAPEILITPIIPIEGQDDLHCEIVTDSVDPEGNSVTYTFDWTLDGQPYTGTTTSTDYAGDTIPVSETVVGEIWECTVTPNDGTEDGHPDSDSVEIVADSLDGDCVNGIFWPHSNTTLNAPCLGQYYQHANAVAVCSQLGSDWYLPSIAEASAYLATMSSSQQLGLFPLTGNGSGGTCMQTQAGGNGVWWLSDHNGQSGGASIFCNSAGCYTTGTQMGDIYFYMVRCVRNYCN